MSDMILKPRAVFFDWDGTLVDSFEFLYRAHNHVRGVLRFDSFSIETFGGYFGQPREKLYTEIYGEHREEAKTHFEAFVLANHVNDLKPLDGAAQVLEWYARAGIPMGVVTNKKGDLVRTEIANFGWSDYFVTVVGAAEAEADKPSPAPLLLALEQAGIDAPHDRIVYVGDTDNDLLCAQAAGCGSILIAEHDEHAKLAEGHKIDVHFESCRGFYDFLLQFSINSLNTKTIG
jgi:phosphoglycolate phosphatase